MPADNDQALCNIALKALNQANEYSASLVEKRDAQNNDRLLYSYPALDDPYCDPSLATLFQIKVALETLKNIDNLSDDRNLKIIKNQAREMRNALVHGYFAVTPENFKNFMKTHVQTLTTILTEMVRHNRIPEVERNTNTAYNLRLTNSNLFTGIGAYGNPNSNNQRSMPSTERLKLAYEAGEMFADIDLNVDHSINKRAALNCFLNFGEMFRRLGQFDIKTIQTLNPDSNFNVMALINDANELAHTDATSWSMERIALLQNRMRNTLLPRIQETRTLLIPTTSSMPLPALPAVTPISTAPMQTTTSSEQDPKTRFEIRKQRIRDQVASMARIKKSRDEGIAASGSVPLNAFKASSTSAAASAAAVSSNPASTANPAGSTKNNKKENSTPKHSH